MKKLTKHLSCLLASKRVWSLVSAGIILGSVPSFADSINSATPDVIDAIDIEINSADMKFQSHPFIVNDRTVVPVRDLANALDVDGIEWDGEREIVTLTDGGKSVELYVNTNIAKVNNETVVSDAPISIYNGRSYIPLRLVAEAFHCDVDWDGRARKISITTNENINADVAYAKETVRAQSVQAQPTSNSNYSQDDLYWLSRLVQAEASGEPFDGKLGVANVIINRKKSSEFPNTIKGAIFDTKYGVQFTPTANGMIYKAPSDESIKAARMALEGTNNVGACLYFVNPRKATNTWIMRNRKKFMTIDLHDFYL